MRPWLLALAVSTPVAAEPSLGLTTPAAPPPRVIQEDGSSPLYYRIPPDVVRPLTRSGIGMELRPSGAGFAFDVLGGAAIQFGRASNHGIWIEGGYSYAGFGDHLFILGAGPSLRGLGPTLTLMDEGALGLAIIPHAVIGRADGELGYGVRTSAVATFWIYGLEIAHQVLVVGSKQVHELHVTFTFPLVSGGDE